MSSLYRFVAEALRRWAIQEFSHANSKEPNVSILGFPGHFRICMGGAAEILDTLFVSKVSLAQPVQPKNKPLKFAKRY